jgi:ectoine hydroxylase-related dioxygenase (phytanoyl-CoA dioxygenase family)
VYIAQTSTGPAQRSAPTSAPPLEKTVINQQDVSFYREQGYLVVNNVLNEEEVKALRSDLDKVVEDARSVRENNDVYDLETTHTPDNPRVRRIKHPHKVMPTVMKLMRHPVLVEILRKLIGPGVRFQTSKLNMKSAGFGAAVEWHQDWAFYPHTNDDLLAVGVMLDDVGEINGPMQVIPGSHRGKIHDHHDNGYFCGAINPATADLDFDQAVPLTGAAGSMTFHHVRAVHGSALNRSDRSRNFLLYQFTAADAWPLTETVTDLDEYNSWLVAGEPTIEPRVTPVPVRLPLPPAPSQGSIYENQRTLTNRYFEVAEETTAQAGQ